MLTKSITLLSMNALEISRAVENVYFMAQVVKSKTNDTRTYIQVQEALSAGQLVTTLTEDQKAVWKMTLDNLVQTLDKAYNDCKNIRIKLESVTKDIVELKSHIEGMIATAETRIKAESARLQSELDKAEAEMAKHSKNCFANVGEALKTIFSFGISCYNLDKTLKASRRNIGNIKTTKENFENHTGPLLEKLKGLNGVSETLLKDALAKTSAIKGFEVQLKLALDKFKTQQATDLCIRMGMLRGKMINDCNMLMTACDKVMVHTKKEEGDFKNILISVNEEKKAVGMKLLNLAAAPSQLLII